MYHSDWLASMHCIAEITVDRVSKAKLYSDFIKKFEFETMNVFEQENNSGIRLTEKNYGTRLTVNIPSTDTTNGKESTDMTNRF